MTAARPNPFALPADGRGPDVSPEVAGLVRAYMGDALFRAFTFIAKHLHDPRTGFRAARALLKYDTARMRHGHKPFLDAAVEPESMLDAEVVEGFEAVVSVEGPVSSASPLAGEAGETQSSRVGGSAATTPSRRLLRSRRPPPQGGRWRKHPLTPNPSPQWARGANYPPRFRPATSSNTPSSAR
ncbi:MAG: hypothetical protein ABGY75_13045 [Gemmataceae bacterium]